MKTIQEIAIIENTEISPYSVKNVGYIQEDQYNLYRNVTHRPRSNCQVPMLPENVNYTKVCSYYPSPTW